MFQAMPSLSFQARAPTLAVAWGFLGGLGFGGARAAMLQATPSLSLQAHPLTLALTWRVCICMF